MAAIDRISDPRVKKERKLYAGQTWKCDAPETPGASLGGGPLLDPSPFPPTKLTRFRLDGRAMGYVNWDHSRFVGHEFFVWLHGADRYIVVAAEKEEGYVPPPKIDFGPTPSPGGDDE